MKATFKKNDGDLFVFIIDEPEKNVNPLIQESFMKALSLEMKELNFEKNNLYILLTTHSMNIIPTIDKENMPTHFNFVEREPELETFIQKNDFKKISNANKYLIDKKNEISNNLKTTSEQKAIVKNDLKKQIS